MLRSTLRLLKQRDSDHGNASIPSIDHSASLNIAVTVGVDNNANTANTASNNEVRPCEVSRVAAAWAILVAKYLNEDKISVAVRLTSDLQGGHAQMLKTVNLTMSFEDQDVEIDAFVLSVASQLGLDEFTVGSEWQLQMTTPFTSLLHRATDGWSLDRSGQTIKFAATKRATDPSAFAVDFLCGPHVAYPKQLQRLREQFFHIFNLLGGGEGRGGKLSDMKSLTTQDRDEILGWNATPPRALSSTIPDLFTSKVDDLPEGPAIHAWDGDLTYIELDVYSSALAQDLIQLRGVGRGSRVLVGFEKSMWNVVAMLAVLKAGAVCVPLEVSHPIARNQTVAEAASATILLTSPASAHRFAPLAPSVQIVQVSADSISETCLKQGINAAAVEPETVLPSDLAFIMFTSGSTGTPKAICLDHLCMATSIVAHGKAQHVDSTTRMLQFAAHVFDICYYEVFTTLLFGGCVCIPTDGDRINRLPNVINELGVNQAALTNTVAESLDPCLVPGLTRLSVGGEPISRELVHKWTANPEMRLCQGYGPSECAICCTAMVDLTPDDAPFNVGRAFQDSCRAWVVDPKDHDKLAPVGAVGELVIEGPTVACGYLNNAELTRAAFIDPPSWLPRDHCAVERCNEDQGQDNGCASTRLFKTGDLVRYHDDGTLGILGRRDTQAKVHGGLRIELGDVEHYIKGILQQPDLSMAVDVIIPKEASRRTLAVFFQPENLGDSGDAGGAGDCRILAGEAALDASRNLLTTLQEGLASILPKYMTPEVAIPLSTMPRNVSFKVDRRTLKDLASELPRRTLLHYSGTAPTVQESQSQPQHPLTTTAENKMARLWEAVLNVPVNSAADSFIRLGGDSIAAMHLVAEARRAGLGLSVKAILSHPVLSDMASTTTVLPGTSLSGAAPDMPRIQPFELLGDAAPHILDVAASKCHLDKSLIVDMYPTPPLPALFMKSKSNKPDGREDPFIFPLPSHVDLDLFKTAWEAVVRQHSILRTRVIATPGEKPKFFQVIASSKCAVHWDAEGKEETTTLHQYLRQVFKQTFSLGDPLTRQCVLVVPASTSTHDEAAYFVWTANHAVYDSWTRSLVLNALDDIYGALVAAARSADRNSLTSLRLRLEQDPEPEPEPSYPRFIQESVLRVDKTAAYDFALARFRRLETCFPLWAKEDMPSPSYIPAERRLAKRLVRNKNLLVSSSSSSSSSLSSASLPGATVTNMIYAAWAMVMRGSGFSPFRATNTTPADDDADRTVALGITSMGRGALVAGLGTERLAAPLMTHMLLAIPMPPGQSVAALTAAVQDEVVAHFPYEHLAQVCLRRAGPAVTEDVMRKALQINILPAPKTLAAAFGAGGGPHPAAATAVTAATGVPRLDLHRTVRKVPWEGSGPGSALCVEVSLHDDGGMEVHVRFDEQLFPEQRVERVLDEFERYLGEVVDASSVQASG